MFDLGARVQILQHEKKPANSKHVRIHGVYVCVRAHVFVCVCVHACACVRVRVIPVPLPQADTHL